MQLLNPEYDAKSELSKRAYTVCNFERTHFAFFTAVMFVIGSILFFADGSAVTATLCFQIGSIFFP